jgi:hypothetical protein
MDREGVNMLRNSLQLRRFLASTQANIFFHKGISGGGQHAPKQFAGRREIRSPPRLPIPF